MDRDSYDDVDDDRGVTAGGSGGAILGVLMTLVIGCGLVFAAYKLGQRTSVDDPPLLRADAQEAKMAPLDEGGTPIANQDNDAYTMVDGTRRDGVASGEIDGVLVTDRLPARELDPTSALAVTAAQQDALRIDELQPAPALRGQPSLTDNDAPDRSDELQLAGGADVTQASDAAVLGATDAATNAARDAANAARDAANGVAANGTQQVAGLTAPSGSIPSLTNGLTTPGLTTPGLGAQPLVRAPDTTIAVPPATAPGLLTEDSFGAGIVAPLPRSKPDLGPSITSAGRTITTARPASPLLRPGVAAPSAAVATTILPNNPLLPGQAAAPTLQVQPVRAPIPAQPRGDAQVQLGAMPTPGLVRSRWGQLQAQHPDLLGRLGLQVLPVRTAQGQELHRLRVGPLPSTQAAAQLCAQLRGRGTECFVPARQ